MKITILTPNKQVCADLITSSKKVKGIKVIICDKTSTAEIKARSKKKIEQVMKNFNELHGYTPLPISIQKSKKGIIR